MKAGPQQQQIPIEQTTGIVCENCTNATFIHVVYLRMASRFITGAPRDALMPLDSFACAKCGHVNDNFNPTKQSIDDGE